MNIKNININIEQEIDNRGIDYKYVAGGNKIVTKCSIHNDKDYAFYINIDNNDYYYGICKCFSCGYRADIFSFLAEYDGVNIKDILRKFQNDITLKDIKELKNLFKRKIEGEKKDNPEFEIKTLKFESLFKKFTSEYDSEFLKYMRGREIDIKQCRKFEIMQDKRVKIKKKGRIRNNPFYKGIVFIYRDPENRIRGISWRAIKEKKIMNLEGYQSNQMLYGLHNLILNNFFGKNYIILVEGEFDTIHLQSMEIPAVGLLHKGITRGQLDEIDKYVPSHYSVVLMFDGDVKNRDKRNKGLLELKEEVKAGLGSNRKVYIAKIQEKEKDPDDFGLEEIKKILKKFDCF